MDNKKYLDKVIGSLVRGTNIDYENGRIFPSFFPSSSFSSFPLLPFSPTFFFSEYCRNQFGLTKDEIDYVWDQYKIIITDKIKNNEQ